MSTERLAAGAHLAPRPRNSRIGYPRRRAVGSDEHEATEIQLRQALAREAALLRERDELLRNLSVWRESAANHFAKLTPRECEIMGLVLAGQPSKNIAADLGISQRTVENHRATIMHKTGSRSLPALAQLAMAATGLDPWNLGVPADPSSPQHQQKWHDELPIGAFCAPASTAQHDTVWMSEPVGTKS